MCFCLFTPISPPKKAKREAKRSASGVSEVVSFVSNAILVTTLIAFFSKQQFSVELISTSEPAATPTVFSPESHTARRKRPKRESKTTWSENVTNQEFGGAVILGEEATFGSNEEQTDSNSENSRGALDISIDTDVFFGEEAPIIGKMGILNEENFLASSPETAKGTGSKRESTSTTNTVSLPVLQNNRTKKTKKNAKRNKKVTLIETIEQAALDAKTIIGADELITPTGDMGIKTAGPSYAQQLAKEMLQQEKNADIAAEEYLARTSVCKKACCANSDVAWSQHFLKTLLGRRNKASKSATGK